MDRVSDRSFIGWCVLTRWNPDYRRASLGYCLDAATWGHGYATEVGRRLAAMGVRLAGFESSPGGDRHSKRASAHVLESLDSFVKGRCGKTAS